jgi:hypothetical protein
MTPHDEAIDELREFSRRTFELSKHLGALEDVPSRLLPEQVEALDAIIRELGLLVGKENAALQRHVLEVCEARGTA